MIPILPLALLATAAAQPGPGIPKTLAVERAAIFSNLYYSLIFTIPAVKSEPVSASVEIRFALKAPHNVVLDFEQPPDRIRMVRSNGHSVTPIYANGHILLPASSTKTGTNAVLITFLAGDEPLNRNDDFLYTLFVPARAHLAFPCFDQPDLKARYSLTLHLPEGWQSVSNGAVTSLTASTATASTATFAETRPLPTYLFAFAAGRFQMETASRNGREFRMFHRETDPAKVARNRDAIFDAHANSLAWLEQYTGISYPWGKFDFFLVPSFQFGGMEHPGSIFYNASGLLLDPSATQAQQLGRASVIAHETAHMWFGDLVTMRWFNDVWMKEVLANFMAAKIVNPQFPALNHDLRFLLAHYPAAYDIDRTAGANPIRQPLANLNEAGTLYGNIIYNKAPIVMRQLELITGEDGFRDVLRKYLKRYSFANATWLDLVGLFDKRNNNSITPFSHAWVEMRGRPTIASTGSALVQTGSILWPQRLVVTVGYVSASDQIPLTLSAATTPIPGIRPDPLYVLPNGKGLGYALFRLDIKSRTYLLNHIEDVNDPLTRGSAWVSLWEEMLEAQITPEVFLKSALRALPHEPDEQNIQRVLSYLSRAFWRFLPQSERVALAPSMETVLRNGLANAATPGAKSSWFNTYRETTLTTDWLERVWRHQEAIAGLNLAENDEIELALNLAVRNVPNAAAILDEQATRIRNPDRKARFEFVQPFLSADPKIREAAFARLRDPANRRHEPWVLESLHYLNHPLREEHAIRFLPATLSLLPEIQKTGDIFFPKRWMDAALSGHRSPEAVSAVRSYLANHPELPERLRWVILSSADDLFRVIK